MPYRYSSDYPADAPRRELEFVKQDGCLLRGNTTGAAPEMEAAIAIAAVRRADGSVATVDPVGGYSIISSVHVGTQHFAGAVEGAGPSTDDRPCVYSSFYKPWTPVDPSPAPLAAPTPSPFAAPTPSPTGGESDAASGTSPAILLVLLAATAP